MPAAMSDDHLLASLVQPEIHLYAVPAASQRQMTLNLPALKHSLIPIHGHRHLTFAWRILEGNLGSEGLLQRPQRVACLQCSKIGASHLGDRLQRLHDTGGAR